MKNETNFVKKMKLSKNEIEYYIIIDHEKYDEENIIEDESEDILNPNNRIIKKYTKHLLIKRLFILLLVNLISFTLIYIALILKFKE